MILLSFCTYFLHATNVPILVADALPRRDFHFNHLDDQFAPTRPYFESIVVIGLPFVAVGLFGLVLICSFIAWKLFSMYKTDVQMTQELDISRGTGFFFVAVSGLLVGICVCLLGSNTVFHGSMKELSADLYTTAQALLKRGISTIDLIEQNNLTMITDTDNIMSIFDIARSSLQELVAKKSTLDDVEELRFAFIASACTITIVGCLVVIHILVQGRDTQSSSFSWSTTYGKTALAGIVGCAVLQCLIWGGSGFHASISVLCSDLCTASNHLDMALTLPISNAADSDPGTVAQYVDFFAYCNTSSPFEYFLQTGYSFVTALDQKINASIASHVPPQEIATLQNNTAQLLAVIQSLDVLFSCSLISSIYFSTNQLACVKLLNSGFATALILAGMGLLNIIVLFYFCRLISSSTSRPRYALVSN